MSFDRDTFLEDVKSTGNESLVVGAELLLAEYDEALEVISGFMEAWKDLKIAEAQQEQAKRLWTPGK